MSIRKRASGSLRVILRLIPLVVLLLGIGIFTAYASANTYETVVRSNLPYSNIVTTVDITKSRETDQLLVSRLGTTYEPGSFGVPKKVKLPESNKHYDLVAAAYDNGWEAGRSTGQMFLIDSPRNKVFGRAVIFMRINTPTTRNVGEALSGDIVNVVTTEGWQLGYKVAESGSDISELIQRGGNSKDSEIIVVLIDERDHGITSFRAVLAKVGERI